MNERVTAIDPAPSVDAAAVEGIVATVGRLAAAVFGVVEELRTTVEAVLAERPVARRRDLEPVEAPARRALEQVGGAISGAGFVAAPGLLADAGYWLEWWTVDDDRHRAVRLLVETDTTAEGFRDYTVLSWFDGPLHSGLPHVAGPYVDYLCSDEYMLTFTTPVRGPEGFAGVVGADVCVRHVERLLLRRMQALGVPAALVNAAGRVVVSTRPDLVVGHLVRNLPADALHPCPGLPFALLVR